MIAMSPRVGIMFFLIYTSRRRTGRGGEPVYSAFLHVLGVFVQHLAALVQTAQAAGVLLQLPQVIPHLLGEEFIPRVLAAFAVLRVSGRRLRHVVQHLRVDAAVVVLEEFPISSAPQEGR